MRLQQTRTARRGVTIVELAIVIATFLAFLFTLYDYGRFIMARQLIENAAREGSRQATTDAAALTTADIQATVTDYLMGTPLNNLTITVYLANPSTGADITPAGGSWKDAQFGEAVAVKISGDYVPMLPTWSWLTNSLTLRALAVTRSEAND